jgi:Zn-dependent protease with chaperone function
MKQQLGNIVLLIIIILIACWFNYSNNRIILITSIFILLLLVFANIMTMYIIKSKSNNQLYDNLFQNKKTELLEYMLSQKGIKVKIYTYLNNNLTVSLLPSSTLTVVFSLPMLNMFSESNCIDMIFHEIGHFKFREFHISEMFNITLNIIFLCFCLTILYLSKIILGSALWGCIINFLFTYLFLKIHSILRNKLFLYEEFYADKYAYNKIPNCQLIDIYKKISKYNYVNREYIELKINKLEENYGTHK